ncbi:GRIP and coiled-coil domain-containing protein 2 [Arachis ipaensis]|uniref:GRIP and coiled-coil domain-containing protein 2 n=1 Tax=Arachis ipaensis TaxID=130454 RepID=UPI000A2B450C|nr:GRIP and coiled-coil domain-containing protein 2 [Arachis ipaensis]
MDRSKSRTDLLAAGKKRLQQFRQKKDGKGGSSRGKSKKSDKNLIPEDDTDGQSSPSMSTTSSQVTDGNVETDNESNAVSAELLESQSSPNSLTLDNLDPSADSSPLAIINTIDEETELDSGRKSSLAVQEGHEVDSELSSQDQGKRAEYVGADVAEDVSLRTSDDQKDLESDRRPGAEAQEVGKEDSELSFHDQGKNAQNVGAAVADDISLKTTDSLGPEGGPTYDHESAPAIVATAVGEPVPVTAEGDSREVSLLLSEDTTITSLMQTREDKVTNLGAMQDADGLDTKKSGQSTDVEEAFHKTEQLGKSVEVVSSPKDIMPDKHLTSNQGQGDDIATGGPSVKNPEGEILSGSSHEEMHLQPIQEQIVEQVHSGHGRGLQEEPYQQSTPVGSIALDPNYELSMGDDAVNLARPVDASHSFDAKTVDFMKLAGIIKDLNEDVLAEIIRGLNEDEFYFLLKSRREVSDADPLATSSTLPDGDFSEAFQRLKEELFLSTLMKSISDMQLSEHLELQLQADNEHPQFVDEVSELRASHLEVNEKNQLLIEELSNCRAELQDVSQKCVELQNQFNAAKGVVDTLSARVVELQISCEVSQEDSLNLSADLSDCRSLISCLQSEKKGMNENLELVSSEKVRLANEKEVHLGESKRLSTELSDLKSSMEVIEVGNEVFDDSLGFVSLKTCLNEMEKILAKLEQATNEFHFQSVGRSGEQVSPAAVSKTHEDEHEVEVRDSNEVHSSSESFIMFAKEETGNMRKLLSEWKGHVQSADALFKGERDGRKIGDAKNRDLKDQFEELKQHCSNLEASNVELTVQCEAAKQLLADFQEKKCHLEELCEALKQEDIQLKAKNNELYEKLGQFQSKVSELYTEICDVKQSSNEMSSIIGDQLENLQKELTQRTMVLEQGWNTIMADIFKLVSKLNESVGETSSAVSFDAHDNLDINNLLAVSVNAATKMIFDLRKKLEATCSEHETICSSFKEVNMKCEDLLGRNELAVGVLHKIYNDLRKLLLSHSGSMGEEKIDVQSEALPDLLNYDSYQNIMRCLVDLLTEKRELESVNNEMKSEMEELKIKCLDLDSVSKLIEDLAGALNIEHSQIERNKTPLSCLDSLVSSLLQKTRDAEIQLHMTKEGYGYSETELAELEDKMHYLDTLRLEKENEILVLKEILHQAEEALTAARSELHEKTNELEYSEQKVSSVREKLSIAVAKGKGLVVQRDGLKQSLAETSSELERCMQELQLKDARLHEVETKLKTYAEAGERMEAMESELSYIRNSSNSLRESFLLKDSMLQRIEEVLEELDLPEQFHSGDIIEKIDWLARSVASNSLPMNDWEQKESAGGVSYADAGYVARESLEDDSQLPPDSGDDSRKDDSQLQSDPGDVRQQQEELQASLVPLDGDDLRKKFEELHKKYFGLAEQNEMLEQSLMERNSIVQRWEELVDRIDMPSHLRSVEMEDRIEWVGRALAEANHHVDSLQLKIEKYESYCGLLNSDLEGSQRTVSALQTDLRSLTTEREHLSEKLEVLMFECEKLSMEVGQKELENEKLHTELASLKDILEKKDSIEEQVFAIDKNLVSGSANIDTLEELLRKLVENQASLQSKKDTIEEQIFTIDVKLRKLHDLVGDVLPESETENLVSGSANIDSLEELLRKLIENQASLQSNKLMHVVELASDSSQQDGATILEARSTDMHDKEEADIDRYKKDLEEALSELAHAKEEREKTLEKQMSLSTEVEALSKRIEELQLLLNQEEQKSASVREKLNVAVRKGKSLVQHRDSLKQTIEEMTTEITQLKSEISNREDTLAEHAQKLSHLSTYPNRLEALESEMIHLKNHLAESEHHLQEKEYSLNLILNKLGEIEIGGEGYISDPIKKLECIEKLCSDLHGTVASLEQESRKSKRAAELLLAELNEVQERNDAFQEELAKADAELVDLRKERDSFEAAKLEALSHLQKLSALHEEGKKNHSSEMTALKSSMNELCTGFGEIQHLLVSAFSMDLESFQNLEAGLKSCIKGSNATNMLDSSVAKTHNGMSPCSSITKQSSLSSDSRSDFDTVGNFHLLRSQLQEVLVEIGSLKERITMHSSLMLEQDKNLSELMASIEKEMTIQRESCEAMKQKVTNQDGELVALRGSIDYLCEACISSVNEIENGKAELVGNKVESDPGINLMLTSFGDGTSEERIRTLVDRLLMAAKSVATIRTGFADANHNEMKATITNLQLELQEKDVQRERICSELVKQIKDAEASANSYSQDLQSLKIQEHNLKKQVEVIEAERKILEERVNELQEKQRIAAELEEKTKSQTDLLAAKDQEIESLMHALDEEEMQMEELTNKIVELEKVVQQKTQEIESLDSSRGKVMKKLAVTVGKFDELHHLSASLLSEVERLQSQLQERDSEISFLRQEVTRCTNDVLLATQMSNKAGSDEIFELLMWVDTMISQEGMDDILPDLKSNSQVHEYKEILQKKLMSVLSELENLKAVAENKDAMLQEEKSKVEKLNHKAETLEKSLHEKEMQLNLLEGVEENGKGASTSSEILEVEPVVNEWRTTGSFVTPQVRSLRKGNNDYVAIAVDEDPVSTSRIEDEEDDKVHGFKSLSSSKIVPRFTRPVTDLIDGLWVSCDRTLMRRPILRLGIIIYWAIVHALLAFFVV